MAAVARVECKLVSPPGESGRDKGYCNAAVEAGQPIIILSTTPPNATWEQVIGPAVGTVANGIALKDCEAGGTAEYAYFGEIDGYTGLTRGAFLTIVGGDIDDTAPAGGAQGRITAITTSRIRFNLF